MSYADMFSPDNPAIQLRTMQETIRHYRKDTAFGDGSYAQTVITLQRFKRTLTLLTCDKNLPTKVNSFVSQCIPYVQKTLDNGCRDNSSWLIDSQHSVKTMANQIHEILHYHGVREGLWFDRHYN